MWTYWCAFTSALSYLLIFASTRNIILLDPYDKRNYNLDYLCPASLQLFSLRDFRRKIVLNFFSLHSQFAEFGWLHQTVQWEGAIGEKCREGRAYPEQGPWGQRSKRRGCSLPWFPLWSQCQLASTSLSTNSQGQVSLHNSSFHSWFALTA